MGRKQLSPWRWRLGGFVLLLAVIGAGYGWWMGQHWMPSRMQFPAQGALVSGADGAVDFRALKAIGADFVYLQASNGGGPRDPAFAGNFRAAQAAGLKVGVVHQYDPCVAAERQAAGFVTVVPRDPQLLPPAVALDTLAVDCADPMSEEGMESELTTFLNQVEGHTGQPAVLKVSPQFEDHYRISSRLERNLWLERDWLAPGYAVRPWRLWTANASLRTEAAEAPLHWVALQP